MGKRVTCPSFVGREAQLRQIEAAAEAATDRSQVVLVGGDAGAGKTRLIDEVCARWRDRGHAAVVGGCVDLGDVGIGYSPLVEVLRHVRTELGADLLDHTLEEAAPALRPLLAGASGPQVGQGAVLAHAVALLEALGAASPGLLVVFEDLHWADPSTRALVAFLARNLGPARVALVASYRADDLHRRHPLRPLLAELTRSPAVEHVELRGMSRSELTVLLAGVSGTIPTDATVDEVLVRSEGNPFYAEELLAARTESDPLPATVRDAILVRTARLPAAVQSLLSEAALLGAQVDDRLLAAATGRPNDEVATALHEALAHQILVADGTGCRFRHALVREVLQDELLPGERQALHERAAAALEGRPDLSGDDEHRRWALLAHHWGAAQDQPHAFAASVRAGTTAEDVGAMADAAAHYQRALELWPRVPDPASAAGMTSTELLLRAADTASHAGSPSRAVGLVEMALQQMADASPEARAMVLERLGYHRWVACDEGGSGAAREDAAALLADRPPSEAKALALAALGRHQSLLDHFVEAEDILRRALDVAAATGSSAASIGALSGLGITLLKLGRVDEGVETSWRSLHTAQREGTSEDISLAYVNLTATLVAAGRWDEAAGVARTGLEHARRAGMLASDGVLIAYGGAEALCWLGSWDEATALLAASGARSDGPHGTTGAVLDARIALWQGQHEDAVSHCDRALTVVDGGTAPAPEALICAAQVAGADGRYDDARHHCAEAVQVLERSEDLALVAWTFAVAMGVEADRMEAARLQGPRGAAAVGDHQRTADDLLAMARQRVQRLLDLGILPTPEAAAHLAVLEAEHSRASGRPAPDRWSAVADAWDALAAPYPAAVARFREADAVLRGGEPRSRAADAARSALVAGDRLGAEPLAAQVRLLGQRGRLDLTEREEPPPPRDDPLAAFGISPREVEVLALLGLGRTNRQIAGELYISEKTASVHVTHLLRKLNVASRVEAAAVAQRLGVGA